MHFTCPSCRGSVVLPPRGVLDLPQNTLVTEAAEKVRLRLAGRLECQLCCCEEDVYTCKHCDQTWCRDCGAQHKIRLFKDLKKLQNHMSNTRNALYNGEDVKEVSMTCNRPINADHEVS